MDASASKRRHRRRIRTVLLAVLLGLCTSPLVAILSGAFLPIRALSRGIVECDGDHLQLWVLSMEFPTGDRTIWFEKGRIYNRSGIGPPGGSSAAVSNWSYATATRSDKRFTKGAVDLPADVRAQIVAQPAKVWGIAVDQRGWPWPAMEARIAGTMDPTSPSPYVATTGVLLPSNMKFPGISGSSSAFGGGDSFADLRVLPTRPLWAGLLADAAVLAVCWWLALSAALFALRTIVARFIAKPGRCKSCGYDLAGLPGETCPECGAKHPPKSPEKTTESRSPPAAQP